MGCAHGEERPAGVTEGNSPQRAPRLDESPAHCGAAYSRQGACPLDTEPTMHTNSVSRASGRAQHAGDIKRGMCTAQGKKEAIRLREQCTCGAREQMAYAIGNFAPGGCSPSSQYRRTRYCYAAAPALRNSAPSVTSLALQAGRNSPAAGAAARWEPRILRGGIVIARGASPS